MSQGDDVFSKVVDYNYEAGKMRGRQNKRYEDNVKVSSDCRGTTYQCIEIEECPGDEDYLCKKKHDRGGKG